MTGGEAFSWDPGLPTDPGFDWAAAKRDLFGGFDITTPFMVRVWNVLGGGKDNYPADRNFVEHAEMRCPQIVDAAHYRQVFRARAVRAMVGEYGIGQLLVAGTDLPLRDEVHDIAQRIDPRVRVVYADPDPWVMAHARALLAPHPPSVCGYVAAGLHDPAAVLEGAAQTLDLDRPVGVLLINSLDGLDDAAAVRAVGVLCAALPRGSCLAICHLTGETGQVLAALGARGTRRIPGLPHTRTPDGVRALFAGLELVEPGVVAPTLWRPEVTPFGPPPRVDARCGVAVIGR